MPTCKKSQGALDERNKDYGYNLFLHFHVNSHQPFFTECSVHTPSPGCTNTGCTMLIKVNGSKFWNFLQFTLHAKDYVEIQSLIQAHTETRA